MNTNPQIYGNQMNIDAVKCIKELNEKISKETDKEKLIELEMRRLNKGLELNSPLFSRTYRSMFPY